MIFTGVCLPETCAVGNGGCQHVCQDTPDGPACSCAPKYILQDNKKTCIGKLPLQLVV